MSTGDRIHRFTLAFEDAALEAAFLDDYAASVRGQARVAWLVAVLIMLALWPLDPPDDRAFYARAVRYGLGVPPGILMFALTFAKAAVFRRAWVPVSIVGVLAQLAIMPGTAFAWQKWVPAWELRQDAWLSFTFGLLAVVFLLIVTHTVVGLRFVHACVATAFGATVYVVYVLALSTSFEGDDVQRMHALAVIWPFAAVVVGMVGSYNLERSRRRVFLESRKLEAERAKSERLLRNVLPPVIAERLKKDPSHIADGFSEVTVLFADIVGFTVLSARLPPAEVVSLLNRLFTAFDELAEERGLEKIKTIGDAYMVVGGLPEPRDDHAQAVAELALAMREAVRTVARETGHPFVVRIGIHSGPVVAGVIGKKKFAYDLWGDTVNTASRMESHGIPGEIQISETTRGRLQPRFDVELRGPIDVKGKGELTTWMLRGLRLSGDAS